MNKLLLPLLLTSNMFAYTITELPQPMPEAGAVVVPEQSFSWHTKDSLRSPWTKGDTIREIAYASLLYVDWKQTREFTREKYRNTYYEMNPLLGKHPSKSKVNMMCLGSAVGHYAISRMLPDKWRHAWQYVCITAEAGAVGNNYSVGVRVSLP